MKIFLSVSYSSQVDSSGSVLPSYRSQLEELINGLEKMGHRVFCAPREDNWKLNDLSPGQALLQDLKYLNEADLFVAVFGKDISAGMQLEIGYAFAKNKKIVLVNKEGQTVGYINKGLVETGSANLVSYSSTSEIADKILKEVSS